MNIINNIMCLRNVFTEFFIEKPDLYKKKEGTILMLSKV